jgi:hypothetical protein
MKRSRWQKKAFSSDNSGCVAADFLQVSTAWSYPMRVRDIFSCLQDKAPLFCQVEEDLCTSIYPVQEILSILFTRETHCHLVLISFLGSMCSLENPTPTFLPKEG